VRLRRLDGEAQQMAELQRVLEAAPDYLERVGGAPPGAALAQATYTALPRGKSYDDKFVFGIDVEGRMVGCVDLIRGYPEPTTALIGLLLVAEPFQRRGIGAAAYRAIENFVRSWRVCTRMRIAVLRTNDRVLPFWTALGFVPTGEVKPYRDGSVITEAIVLAKRLAAP
jgi:GNAT superfamily N-acetyltransferase